MEQLQRKGARASGEWPCAQDPTQGSTGESVLSMTPQQRNRPPTGNQTCVKMNPPQLYMCSPSCTLLPPPSPYHPSGLSQCTSPQHPVSCIETGLATRFIRDILHVSMPFSQIFPPSPSLTESLRLFYTSVSLLLSRTQGYCYHLSKFHIYALVYCIGVFLSGLLHSV